MQVDEALVNLQLEFVPGLGALTAGLSIPEAHQKVVVYFQLIGEEEERTVLRVVMRRTLVGRRIGPLTRMSLSLARLIRSPATVQQKCNQLSFGLAHPQNKGGYAHFSRLATLLLVSVIRILCFWAGGI